jgi:zinc finger SWIM domain-containing protein 3
MKFCTEEEAYQFYNAYAGDKGFSIRRSSSHNVKNSTTIKNRSFCCSRAGICFVPLSSSLGIEHHFDQLFIYH